DADVVWITVDTPVDDEDRADVESVVRGAAALFPRLRDVALVRVSQQLPVGTTGRLEAMFAETASGRRVGFAYSPENLRLWKESKGVIQSTRVGAGVRSDADRARI